eukprot:10047044-Alexandrium_andersonii.AAC.1
MTVGILSADFLRQPSSQTRSKIRCACANEVDGPGMSAPRKALCLESGPSVPMATQFRCRAPSPIPPELSASTWTSTSGRARRTSQATTGKMKN